MSNVDINVDRRTDGRTDGRKIGRLYRTLLQAGAIINLFNNHILIEAPVTFAPAGAMTPSPEFLCILKQKLFLLLLR